MLKGSFLTVRLLEVDQVQTMGSLGFLAMQRIMYGGQTSRSRSITPLWGCFHIQTFPAVTIIPLTTFLPH